MTTDAAIAINRFGLGQRRDEAIPAEPKRWLLDQFAAFEPRPTVLASVPTSAAMAAQYHEFLLKIRDALGSKGNPELATIPPMAGAPAAPPPAKSARMEVQQELRQGYRASYIALASGRIAAAVASPAPFAERLTHFWANHFAVSADKLESIGLAGTLEFEAIRPHLFGGFADMLLAVERHPAMLLYLDQAQSIGPDSMIGARAAGRGNAKRKVGLNENLAREIMELHTLGVGSGYTQADVQELARGLTGWSVGGFVRRPIGIEATDGAFVFQTDWHEPGARTLLGVRYSQSGYHQGEAMLRALAVHPATAHHLATKLARHFVADEPPPALVARLAAVHLSTGGNLTALYRALVDAPEAWTTPLAKFKTPWDWTISSLRAVGMRTAPDAKTVGALSELGQPVWRPGSPAGWDDIAASWAAPDALLRRVEVAQRVAAAVGDRLDARALGPQLMPGVWSPSTAAAIAKADSPSQGLAMLLVAPEFLRR
jgi:uncharacterized protein (DUF1800 family)